MMKMSIVEMHHNWIEDIPFPMVAAIHDELVLDVPEDRATEIAGLVKSAMEDVANDMLPGMNFRADVHIGNTWADKE